MNRMRHRQKKIKFKKGKDATAGISRKLLVNFVNVGKIETTLARAKILKSLIDILVYKAGERKNSNENVIRKYFGSNDLVDKMFNTIGPEFKDRKSGFVRIIKTNYRIGDGTEMAKLEWIKPIVEVKSTPQLKVTPEKKVRKVKDDKSNKINKTRKRKGN